MDARGRDALLDAIRHTPIIGNHAHPLLKRKALKSQSLLSIASEAHGEALAASRTNLAHIRSVNQLSRVLDCEANWDAVTDAIQEKQGNEADYRNWTKTCLSGIQCILVDDGLDKASDAEGYDWFNAYTGSPCKRIVRIEKVAQHLIEKACTNCRGAQEAYTTFMRGFRAAISQALADGEVAGFKSVICYRTGLAIARKPDQEQVPMKVFGDIFQAGAASFTRLNHAGLNEYLVHCVAGMMRDAGDDMKKPIQFHTGLGDNDLTLTRASPSHLQEFIREYPTVPMVLLHSGYPFVREMGYLASVYANVYADIGEVFPFVSREGQERIVRQIVELCPTTKILWSTDGHWFPETYLLAVMQMRECLAKVLCDYVGRGDLSWQQAVQCVERLLFDNSNTLYKLGLEKKRLMDEERRMGKSWSSSDSNGTAGADKQNTLALRKLEALGPTVRFLRVCWCDLTATMRMRSMPIRHVRSLLDSGSGVSICVTKASQGLLQTDALVEDAEPIGEWDVEVDWTTLRRGPRAGHATTMGNFVEKDGSVCGLCPRSLLQRALDSGARQHRLVFSMGFEIEMVFVRLETNDCLPLDSPGHAWSACRAMDHDIVVAVLEEAVADLDAAGVYVDLLHAESAHGQYEMVLPKAEAMQAVDTLLYARQVISTRASAKGYRMTLHPKPFLHQPGTAAHAHMSFPTTSRQVYESFYAGVLTHLPAICALSYPSMVSYERLIDSCWAGGAWVAWGTHNRETPLRKVDASHWEIRCIDGLANPYLATAAVLFAGLDGVERKLELKWLDCPRDPALMSSEERDKVGVVEKLPLSVQEALEALSKDKRMCALLGPELAKRYSAIKTEETKLLKAMDEASRRRWIIERY